MNFDNNLSKLKKIFYISILLIYLACKREKEYPLLISNEFKIEFLNEILSDTLDLKIITSKNQLISNYDYMVPPILPIDLKNQGRSISHTKFISDTLKVNDTVFIMQQIEQNKRLDLNQLSKFGFKIFNLKTMVKNKVPYDSINKVVDSLNSGKVNSYSFLKISKPIFNKNKNLVYLMLEHGPWGETLILEKIDNKWRKKHQFNRWIE